ncbi:hypothetical protein K491DRAFT_594942 [Lophiostoma macrostomum CBS 122681]|uniref:DUF2423 domain-containing protein n=1 Tax=Lophiostoma macrostomum CBS 122681 TaxID=1314788 RepID=A0A6A6TC58_9PLEO|nr:hypothetical protein K491DRAFT_594942 [Lophiostoma macrostomum CBS 122681]
MAKSARASVKKSNRTKLRARVFAPVESARTARLHAKLLELAQQPKPEPPKKTDMDVDSVQEPATAAADEYPKGSCIMTAKMPQSLTASTSAPKPTARDNYDMRNLFFHLGLCSDIVGFSDAGELEFAFDPLPQHWLNMEVDDGGATAAASAANASKSKKRTDRPKSKKRKQQKPRNAIAFPQSRGKGALKPHSEGRVSKRR